MIQFTCSESEKKSVLAIEDWWGNSQLETYRIKTSGSTGSPKSIEINKADVILSIQRTADYFQLAGSTPIVNILSLGHIAGFVNVLRALYLKLPLYVASPDNIPEDFFDEISGAFVPMVPLQLVNLLKGRHDFLNKQKAILLGGVAVSESQLQSIKALKVPVFAGYGMTETLTHIAIRKLNGPSANDFYVPLSGIGIKKDQEGCLQIYLPNQKDIIQTNDLVELNTDGNFKILGRKDLVVNSGGIKIQIEEIEAMFQPLISENYCCAAFPNERLGEHLVLIIEGKSKPYDFSNFHFKKYHSPKEIIFVNAIEKTASLKIDRKKTIDGVIKNTIPNSRYRFTTIFKGS